MQTLPMHISEPVQPPQSRDFPQPSSGIVPHSTLLQSVVGLQTQLFPLQLSFAAQVSGQEIVPQPSSMLPHFTPEQSELGTQHVWSDSHFRQGVTCPSQLRVLPQPSSMLPHSAPNCEQVLGWQQLPLTQTSFDAQLPHASLVPQPLSTVPQLRPADMQVTLGLHTHVLLLLQILPEGHVPQTSIPLQLSLTKPHSAPWLWQVVVSHWHTF
jgi:hypothetical protein